MERPRLEVTTPVFEGPLELLLALAEREELDLLTIRLSELTDAYLTQVAAAPRTDPNELAEFLWLGARLLLLKSIRLLPGEEADPEETELLGWEEDVRLRLSEYQAYRRMAESLTERVVAESFSFPPAARQVSAAGQEEPLQIDALMVAFHGLLARLPPRPLVVVDQAWSMDDGLNLLQSQLREGSFDLVQLLLRCRDRLEAVVTFVALLELLRRGRVKIRQDKSFGAIWVEER
ncbi:MAG: segregation/condensation protein A [Candidatus Dormibacteraceae bacterium]